MRRFILIISLLLPSLLFAQNTTYVYYNNMKLTVDSEHSIVLSTEKHAHIDYQVSTTGERIASCTIRIFDVNGQLVNVFPTSVLVNRKGTVATLVAHDEDYHTLQDFLLRDKGFVRFIIPGTPAVSFTVPCCNN